jgi:2'-5' RNA ligase
VLVTRLGEATALAERAAVGQPAFPLTIAAGGGRAGRRGSVAWLRVERGAGQVIALGERLLADCPSGLTAGWPPKLAPSAHLTVARRVDETLPAALRQGMHGPLDAAWTADRVVLYESHLGSAGAAYVAIHEVRLVGGG